MTKQEIKTMVEKLLYDAELKRGSISKNREQGKKKITHYNGMIHAYNLIIRKLS